MELLLQYAFVAALLSPASGFCGDRKLNGDLSRASVKAGEWLREQMGENGTLLLGHATANAFHSLRLVGYSIPKVSKLGAGYLKQEINTTGIRSISGGRLAYYILGVISSCENPKNFNKQNLVAAMKDKMSSYGSVGGFNHPFQLGLALLALCTSGQRVEYRHVSFLVQKLKLSDNSLHGISTLSMGTMALSCIKYDKRRKKKDMRKLLNKSIKKAKKKLINIQRKKGFGNEASTALAVQALLSAGVKYKYWDCEGTMKKLLAMQDKTGAFANVLGTIRALPALIGSVYHDVKDLACPKPDTEEKKKNITVCMRLEFEKNISDKVPPKEECFVILNGTNAHDVMKLARTRHPCYNFTTVLHSWGSSIESICGVSKNHTLKRYWSILVDPGRKPASYGIDTLKPRDGQTLIFRYRQYHWK